MISAWLVHLLTASGAIFGVLALQAIAQQQFKAALGWMMITAAIDAVDGALARWRHVKCFIPHFDGALLDNMVDYFNYVLVPAFFLLNASIVPDPWRLILSSIMILSSAYQFCRDDAKTADHTFTGFPSYWNVVLFYVFLLECPPWLTITVLLVCAVGVFVRIRYLYPSRTPFLRPLNLILGLVWAGLVITAWLYYPERHRFLLLLSFFYLIYYCVISLWLTLRKQTALGDAS